MRHDFRGCPFPENRISKGSEGLVSLLTDSDDNQQQNKYVEGAVISTLDASASLAISTKQTKGRIARPFFVAILLSSS